MRNFYLYIILFFLNAEMIHASDDLINHLVHNQECFTTINGFKNLVTDKLVSTIQNSAIDHFEIDIDSRHLNNFTGVQYCIYDFSYDSEAKKYKILIEYLEQKKKIFIEITGNYKIFTSLIAAKRNIMPNVKITSDDLQSIIVQEQTGNHLSDMNDAVGKVSKNMILAGKLIIYDNLASPMMITKGKKINIIYQKNAVSLKMSGIALESGRKNDTIKIHNPKSNATVYATILSEDTVIIGDNQ